MQQHPIEFLIPSQRQQVQTAHCPLCVHQHVWQKSLHDMSAVAAIVHVELRATANGMASEVNYSIVNMSIRGTDSMMRWQQRTCCAVAVLIYLNTVAATTVKLLDQNHIPLTQHALVSAFPSPSE